MSFTVGFPWLTVSIKKALLWQCFFYASSVFFSLEFRSIEK